MGGSRKAARSAGFILAVVSFMTPFMTLSCPGARFSFTGAQIALGTTINEPQIFGPPKPREIPGDPIAAAAAGSAAAGALMGLAEGGVARAASAGLALAGGATLLTLKNRVDTETQNKTLGLMSVTYEIGYWAALFGYGVALLLNLILGAAPARATSTPEVAVAAAARFISSTSPPVAAVPTPVVVAMPGTGTTKEFCGSCGTKLTACDALFCEHCGLRV